MSDLLSPQHEESPYSRELALLEQVHTAFGAAGSLDEFYTIAASLLVDANTFGFSRAFLLRYDDRSRVWTGRLALGARNAREHVAFRQDLEAEESRLREQVNSARQVLEPDAMRSIYNLRYHSLWIRLLQGVEHGTSMNHSFQQVRFNREDLGPDHLLEKAAHCSLAFCCEADSCSFSGLEEFFAGPVVAGRLCTRRGLHAVLVCDRAFNDSPVDAVALYHFQWLLNHAAVALENVDLVARLTETTQRLEDVDRLKTNFLSVVSHELRTPLTSIVGFVHLLAEGKVGPVTEAQADLLGRVGHHASHLHNMVNDLLEIAEVEAGGMMNVSLGPVDPLQALRNVLPKVQARRGGKQVNVAGEAEGPPPLIRSDGRALERIFFHLLDNAAKFTPADGRISVSFQQENGRLVIAISDTGIGISEENLQRIFHHFYQVDSRLERVYGGMGIGLAVVKLLLEATGGEIRVTSSPGSGSCFSLTYPVAQAGH